MKRSGKSIVMKAGAVWESDFTAKNSKGKKTAWMKAEAKNAIRGFRHDKSYLSEIS